MIEIPEGLLLYAFEAAVDALYFRVNRTEQPRRIAVSKEFLLVCLSLLRFHPEKETSHYFGRELVKLLGDVQPEDLYKIEEVKDDPYPVQIEP